MEGVRKEAGRAPRKPNVVQRFLLCWMCPVIFAGNRRDLSEEDLVPHRNKYASDTLGDRLERKWTEEVAAAHAAGAEPSLARALSRTFLWSYVPSGLLILLVMIMRSFQPVLLARLLEHWSAESSVSRQEALVYAGSLLLLILTPAFLQNHVTLMNYQFGMQMRIAACSLMYRKVLRMSRASLGQTTAGKLINLLSNDVNRFDYAFLYPHYLWVLPIQLALVSYLMYLQAGIAAFIGIASVIVITVPIQAILGAIMAKLRDLTAGRTDERIKKMKEIISGIQVIKMYAWEKPFEAVVSAVRARELSVISKASLVRNTFVSFMMFTEKVALFITLLAYSLLGNQVTAVMLFPVKQFLSLIQLNLAISLPMALAFIAEVKVSVQRIEEFMKLPERSESALKMPNSTPISKIFDKSFSFKRVKKESNEGIQNLGFLSNEVDKDLQLNDVAVELVNVNAAWHEGSLTLKNISLKIPRGQLCAVIGEVGSGKSSLLQLLLKELPTLGGAVSVDGTLSYSAQDAWLFPSSVRENILFGLPYDQKKYRQVCKVCALEKDFKQFPFGDQSLVGERGVSLSGGQRARINLARSVYREADVYLLDDPLSAVDADVGRQLFEGCISGYLRGRTRVLVTHQLHYLRDADFIVVIKEGEIMNVGTYEELASCGTDFTNLLSSQQESDDSSAAKPPKEERKRSRLGSISQEQSEQHEAQILAPEERARGQLRWAVFTGYWRAARSRLGLTSVVLLVLLTQSIVMGIDYWLTYWTNQVELHEENTSAAEIEDFSLDTQTGRFTTGQYLSIMGGLVGACVVAVNARTLLFVRMCARASQHLHDAMFGNMLRAVMRFFDTSSSGRILNRFSKDMGAVDDQLPRTMLETIQIFSNLASVLILNAVAMRWTLIPTFVILTLFFVMMSVYLNAAQSIKRLESTTRSPVFGMVSSTMDGMDTIRASGSQARLIDAFDKCQNVHTDSWSGYVAGGATFGLSLDCVCVAYVALVMATFLFLDLDGAIPVGNVGLAVTQSMLLTSVLQYGARTVVDLLGQMTSVERVLEYTRLQEEHNLLANEDNERRGWPSKGSIVMENVSLRYGPDQRPVLRNINVGVKSGWKVGVVGRTGAGKTSLISALFRFAEIEGLVSIDGVDTATVAKQELRSKISIIPQEPVLFSATLRYNLDPFGRYNDEDLWRALELVNLKDSVTALDFKVTEGGSNFSVGQRQLVCLARAVLRSNKILIMDEATANVDPQTDAFIQQTIRTQFASCTVLTIAHRLNTIMDSDRVLVMDTGEVAEFDHPHILLSDPNSHLSRMVRETGDSMAKQLFETAKETFRSNNMKRQ